MDVVIDGGSFARSTVTRESAGSPSLDADAAEDLWDRVLESRVSAAGLVSYHQLTLDGEDLRDAISAMANAEPESMERDDAVAFWINAHNALAIHAVLSGANPGTAEGRLRLYRWHRLTIARARVTLEEVIRRIDPFGSADPRIYFALSNATRGGPPLAREAYRGAGLDAALARAVAGFIRSSARNQINNAGGRLELSRVFSWHRRAFERAGGSLEGYFALHLGDAKMASRILRAPRPVVFKEFDWALNAAPVAPSP